MTKTRQVTDLRIYQLSEQLAELVWKTARGWDRFAQDTVGKNLVRATDSISLNLAEGFGRYSYRDVLHYSYIARGSFEEMKSALRKAYHRDLLDKKIAGELGKLISALGPQLNSYINEQRERAKLPANRKIKENEPEYSDEDEVIFSG